MHSKFDKTEITLYGFPETGDCGVEVAKPGDLQQRQRTAGRPSRQQQAVGAFAEDLAGLGRGQ